MKLAWSVFWRLFVLLLLLSLVMAIASNGIALLAEPRLFPWKPSLVWGAFASLLVLSLFVFPNGAVHLLWGKSGKGGAFLIGPSNERWDAAMLIRQLSVASFLAFASNKDYLSGIGHRLAALEDSRLLPLIQEQGNLGSKPA